MIKTLRITTIIAAIVAVVLLALPAVYGVRTNPKIEEILKAQTAAEKFSATKGQAPARDEKSSPLVKQAMDFGLYLNPPPPPQIEAPASPTEVIASRPVTVTPKFDLVGVSYYPERPESSYALINEPGKGFSWVKQGSNVEHLVISEIKDGSITVRDGEKTSEMTVTIQESWRDLIKNPSAQAKPAADSAVTAQPARPGTPQTQPGQNPAARTPSRARRGAAPRPGTEATQPPTTTIQRTAPGNPNQLLEQRKIAAPPVQQQQAQPAQVESQPAAAPQAEKESSENASLSPPPLPTEKDIIHTRLMEEVKASKITEEEAKQLEEAATTLEQLEQLEAQRVQKPDANKPK